VNRPHLVEVGLVWPPETFLRQKLAGLAARGFRVTVAAEEVHPSVRIEGVSLLRLGHWQEKRAKTALFLARDALRLALKHPWRLRHLACAIREPRLLRTCLAIALADPGVIQFEWESAAVRFLPLFDVAGCPIVVSCRGSWSNVFPHAGYAGGAARYADVFAQAAAVHCVSEAIAAEATPYGLPADKARVIYAGVDLARFTPRRPARGDALRVLSIGELNWVKGYDDALEAIALLVERGIPVSYEILGGEPDAGRGLPTDRPRLSFLAHELGLADRVRFAGAVPHERVGERLGQADVLLHASIAEGLPNVVLEAMACALPVVVTDCGGLPEAVTDGVEGLVCPARSRERLADALEALWRDPALAERMGDAGRARVAAQFSLERHLDEFAELYGSVSRARRG
jgi:colanic acid/amylovoran biosynthesis glycosyltransferase